MGCTVRTKHDPCNYLANKGWFSSGLHHCRACGRHVCKNSLYPEGKVNNIVMSDGNPHKSCLDCMSMADEIATGIVKVHTKPAWHCQFGMDSPDAQEPADPSERLQQHLTSVREGIVLMGDSVLDDFHWLTNKKQDVRQQIADITGKPCHNLAVDECEVLDVLNGKQPAIEYIQSRRKVFGNSYKYPVTRDRKVFMLDE